jgi:hypothetical protein
MPVLSPRCLRLAQLLCLGYGLSLSLALPAEPLKAGTLLTIKQGFVGYPEGTCSGSYLRYLNDAITCYPFGPGTDGGWVVGKSQQSGGQELDASAQCNQDGELTNAFTRMGYATLMTAPEGEVNRFDDTACSAEACLGKVEIQALHQAYKGQVLPGGCAVADCSATGGSGVRSWVVKADRSYILDAVWGNTQVHLEGVIVLPGQPLPVATALQLRAAPGEIVQWKPQISYRGEEKLRCAMVANQAPIYGRFTLQEDCSVGVYIPPNPIFTGRECKQYQVSAGQAFSVPAAVCVQIRAQEPGSKKKRI